MSNPWRGRPSPFSFLLERVPSQCVVCRAWPSRPVCDACVMRFAHLHGAFAVEPPRAEAAHITAPVLARTDPPA